MRNFVYLLWLCCALGEPIRQLQQWCAVDAGCAPLFKTHANESVAFNHALRILLNASASDALSAVFERHYSVSPTQLSSESLRLHWIVLMKSVAHPFEMIALRSGAAECADGRSQLHYDQRTRSTRCVADSAPEEHWHTSSLTQVAIYLLISVALLSLGLRIYYYIGKIRQL